MDRNPLMKKYLIVVFIILAIGLVSSPSSNANNPISDNITPTIYKSTISLDNGTLSGHVTDFKKNPIEEALVRVYFHDTYRENYSDSTGYYQITNIPICFCMKNATCSKVGYYSEWELLSISENTTYDFMLIPSNSTKLTITILGPAMMMIKNIGNATAYSVSWSLTVHGGFILLGRDQSGVTLEPLEPGQEIIVGRRTITIGYGTITFIGKAWADNAPMVSANLTGRLLFILFLPQ